MKKKKKNKIKFFVSMKQRVFYYIIHWLQDIMNIKILT
jgi:hypothetical protein